MSKSVRVVGHYPWENSDPSKVEGLSWVQVDDPYANAEDGATPSSSPNAAPCASDISIVLLYTISRDR